MVLPSACPALDKTLVWYPSTWAYSPDTELPWPSACESSADIVLVWPSAWACIAFIVFPYPSAWDASPFTVFCFPSECEKLPVATDDTHNNKTLWTSETIFNKINNSFLANSAMRFKGSIGIKDSTGSQSKVYTINGIATPDGKLPKGEVGDTYRISTNGSYGGNACEVGDLLICYESGTTKETDRWTVVQTNINGYSTFRINGTPYNLYTTDSTTSFAIYAPTSAGSAKG